MVAIDNEDGRYIAAAGSRGFAHCNTSTGKWRIFGNECQVLISSFYLFPWA